MKPPIILKKQIGTLRRKKTFNFAGRLTKKYKEARIFLVGGIVRDWLLKRDCQDFDLVISGVPAKKLRDFLKKEGRVNLVGARFGVFKFIPKNSRLTIDIALPRTEHAFGTGGYRDVETQSDWRLPIEKDLARRDFTINALALELKIKNKNLTIENLIDPFGGLKDLKRKLIRAVGQPKERLQEDYSRLLRALRFAAQLNFMIEKKTWNVLRKKMPQINKMAGETRLAPYEVIAKEFIKSLINNPVKTMDLWDASGAFKELMPEILKMKNCPQPLEFHGEGDVWAHTKLALAALSKPGFKKFVKILPPNFAPAPLVSPELVLAILLHDIGKPSTIKTPEKDGTERIRTDEHDTMGAQLAQQMGERLRLNSVPDYPCHLNKIAWLIEKHLLTVHGDPMKFTNRTIEKYFFNPLLPGGDLLKLIYCDQMASYVNGQPQLGSLPRLVKRIKNLLKSLKQKKTLPPPLLDGRQIMLLLKIKPGPMVGKIIEKLREGQLDGKIKNKKQAGIFILKLPRQI
ncbi:MAG: CCA tRNA nucleotidyltransferase [Candidatus Magasanikbacteria bacterium]|nr:CCA tRNA nucleotidyltransferase [Candidatus Magasanikbacteria bacterium]